jgi:putative hydrolase of the HAD superfamily
MTPDVSTPIRYVLFDAVGTLFWPDPPVAMAYQQAGEQFGCRLSEPIVNDRFRDAYRREFAVRAAPVSEADERERWRHVVGAVFPAAADPSGLFEQLWEHFANPHHWRLGTGAIQCMEALGRRGYQLGIASNFDGRLREICRGHHLPIDDPHLFISSELGFAKPQPEFYEAVAVRSQCQPEEILLVGDDRKNDYDGALAAGWQARLIGNGVDLLQVVNELS